MARDGDGASRQHGSDDPVRHQGRRPPGIERLDGQHHDRAVVRLPRSPGPRVGQATRLACAACDQRSAGSSDAPPNGIAACVRRAAELPQPHQGPRPGRLFHRLGRDRCDRDDLVGARAPVRRGPLRGRRRRAAHRADRRCRAGRGRRLGGAGRPHGAEPGRGHVGRRSQPPVARPGRARHRDRPAHRNVPGRRLAHDHGQVRSVPVRAVRPAWRVRLARPDRRDEQRGVPAPAALQRRRTARATARHGPSSPARGGACGRAGRRRTAPRDP